MPNDDAMYPTMDAARTSRADLMQENLGMEVPKRGGKLQIPRKVLDVNGQNYQPGQEITIMISGRVSAVRSSGLELEVDSAEVQGTTGPETGVPQPEGPV